MFGFGKKKSPSVELANATLCAINEVKIEELAPAKPAEEWIWVDGYKATEKDMSCRGYQYEMNKCFDISDDKDIELCGHGFHLCKNPSDVYGYYPVGMGHRFFEVKALVRKKDYEEYGAGPYHIMIRNGGTLSMSGGDKLVAKSIIFTRELSPDEILMTYDVDDWTDEEKKLALETNPEHVYELRRIKILTDLGYSETFARLIIDNGKFEVARSVATQEGLSMDMKVWTIFNATAFNRR